MRTESLVLLIGSGLALCGGVYLTFGLGIALIVLGMLLVAAELLVPKR